MADNNSLLSISSEAITQYRFVKRDGSDNERIDQADTKGEFCLGVAMDTTAGAGENVAIVVSGFVEVEAGGSMVAYDDVTTDASGKEIATDANSQKILGYYAPAPINGVMGPDTDAVSGDRVRIYLYDNKLVDSSGF